jgi:hypothetical protein
MGHILRELSNTVSNDRLEGNLAEWAWSLDAQRDCAGTARYSKAWAFIALRTLEARNVDVYGMLLCIVLDSVLTARIFASGRR